MEKTVAEMSGMLDSLAPLLERRDVVGYAAARNTRRLRDALVEYEQARVALINELGEEETDADGNPTGGMAVRPGTGRFDEFVRRISPLQGISHEVDLMLLPYEDAVGVLSGQELLQVDWMFYDDEEVGDELGKVD